MVLKMEGNEKFTVFFGAILFAAVGVIGTTAVVKPEWLPGIVKAPILYFSVFLDIMIIPFVIDELWWVIPFIFAPMLLGIIYILSRLARGGG